MHETWVVDECGELLFRVDSVTDNELSEYLENHPEHTTRCIEL